MEARPKSPKTSPFVAVRLNEDARLKRMKPNTAADAQPTINLLELAMRLAASSTGGVAKIVGQWQQASTAFAAEKAKTTDSGKLKSLAAHDLQIHSARSCWSWAKNTKTRLLLQAFVAAPWLLLRDLNFDLTGDLVLGADPPASDRSRHAPGREWRVALLAASCLSSLLYIGRYSPSL